MDPENRIPLVPKDGEAPIVDDVSHLHMVPLAMEGPEISPLPRNLVREDYDKNITSLCGGGSDLEHVKKALNVINANNANVGGAIIDNCHVINSSPETKTSVEQNITKRCGEKRTFEESNDEPSNHLDNPPYDRQSKYPAWTRTSPSSNVETPYRNSTIDTKGNTDGNALPVESGIEGVYSINNQGDEMNHDACKEIDSVRHKKLSYEETLRDAWNEASMDNLSLPDVNLKQPVAGGGVISSHSPQRGDLTENKTPLPLALPKEHDWDIESQSPLITLASIEENEDYVDPLLWIEDDAPLEFLNDFTFSFLRDDADDDDV